MSAGAPSIGEEPTQRTEGHPAGTAARPPVLGFIGLGEAGFHIARGLREAGLPGICAFDRYWNVAPQSELVLARAREAGVELQPSLQALVEHCDIVVSAVSATLSVPLAKESAPFLRAGQLFADLNSAGPQTKVEAAAAIAPPTSTARSWARCPASRTACPRCCAATARSAWPTRSAPTACS
ncbi:NAD(P)-binding domain-containing protein [Piscinibacter sakaiensis]|uniref:NAD(P)-binding domain-containing protein n=1 Tax=Piscinibacter sakaiensis TaxID=1547922 RepID=UPI00372C61C1